MNNFLIVGQAPQRSAVPGQRPWDSASGKRLAAMFGVDLREMLESADTCNLNTDLHGTKGKWDVFDVTEARHMADYLGRTQLWRYDVVLLCGQAVAKAFGMLAPTYEHRYFRSPTTLTHRLPTTVYAIPHPGGTNLWWNDPEHRRVGENLANRAWKHARALQGAPVATGGKR